MAAPFADPTSNTSTASLAVAGNRRMRAASISTLARSAKGWFRLFDCESGRLKKFEFGEPSTPAFTAISYVWGDVEPWRVDGEKGDITSISKGEVWRIVHFSPTRYIWMDVLCIDQGDEADIGRFLLVGAKIYACAQTTLVLCDGVGPGLVRCEGPKLVLDPWLTRRWTVVEALASTHCVFLFNGARELRQRSEVFEASLDAISQAEQADGMELMNAVVQVQCIYDGVANIGTAVHMMTGRSSKYEEDCYYALIGLFAGHVTPPPGYQGVEMAREWFAHSVTPEETFRLATIDETCPSTAPSWMPEATRRQHLGSQGVVNCEPSVSLRRTNEGLNLILNNARWAWIQDAVILDGGYAEGAHSLREEVRVTRTALERFRAGSISWQTCWDPMNAKKRIRSASAHQANLRLTIGKRSIRCSYYGQLATNCVLLRCGPIPMPWGVPQRVFMMVQRWGSVWRRLGADVWYDDIKSWNRSVEMEVAGDLLLDPLAEIFRRQNLSDSESYLLIPSYGQYPYP
ncbi:hypothetical protein HDV00_007354 [Rhizophlyctis rosea]|nr:hypothetical protein HDV00_007354 [Rhizophlyctis rosea]